MKQERENRNIVINYLFVFFMSLDFTHGIIIIYLTTVKGFSLLEVGIMEGFYHVASFLMEIPTGAVADVWGRKMSRIIGRFLGIGALFIALYGDTMLVQTLGFMLIALSNNLESGAGDALVYDTLVSADSIDTYMSVAGKQELTFQVASIAAFLAGGVLASISYPVTFGLSAVSYLLAIISALFFTEITIGKKEVFSRSLNREIRKYRDHIISSIRVFHKDIRVLFLMLISEGFFTVIVVSFFYLQSHWTEQGFSQRTITTVFAVKGVLGGIAAFRSTAIEKRLTRKWTLLIILLTPVIALWGIALTPYSFFFYILLGPVEGYLIAAVGTYINELITSKERATVLSMQSMIFSVIMILMFPAFGAVADATGTDNAFLLFALAINILSLIAFFRLVPRLIKK